MATFPLDRAGPPAAVAGGAVTVGNFDGVHRGHRALVAAARGWAARVGGPAVAVTFDPPPRAVLFPAAAAAPPLTTVADRADLLHAAGADHVAVLRADPGLLGLSADDFFAAVVVGRLGAKAVVEGADFRFGRHRTGDVGRLRQLCDAAGLGCEVVPPVELGGGPVSSSRVRAALAVGDVAEAAALLGRPYRLSGVVEPGAKRGRALGFPTANVGGVATLVPATGVYAVRAVRADGAVHAAAANVGPAPTFGVDARKVEVHLLRFAGDLYGQPLAVEFVARLRDTRPFAGPADLVEQLARDVSAADRLLSAGGS